MMPPVLPASADPIRVLSFRTPKQAILTVMKVGIAKSKHHLWESMLLGFMGGAYISLGGLLTVMVAGGFTGSHSWTETSTYEAFNPTTGVVQTLKSSSTYTSPNLGTSHPGLTKLLAGAVFPVGLFLVIIAGAELFTGNVMYMTAAALEKKITLRQLSINWFISFFTNWAGAVVFALFIGYLTTLTDDNPFYAYIIKSSDAKMSMGWGEAVLKGVGCNWMVTMSLFFAISADELIGKIAALWWPVFAFVAIGLEHSIANMFFLTLGLFHGSDKGFNYGDAIARNLIPVTIGNIIGGAVCVALVEWAAYGHHFGEVAKMLDTRPGKERIGTPAPSIVINNGGPIPAPSAAPSTAGIAAGALPSIIAPSAAAVTTSIFTQKVASTPSVVSNFSRTHGTQGTHGTHHSEVQMEPSAL